MPNDTTFSLDYPDIYVCSECHCILSLEDYQSALEHPFPPCGHDWDDFKPCYMLEPEVQ